MTSVYEIAPIEDRALELARHIATAAGAQEAEVTATVKPLVDAGDYAGFIIALLDAHEAAFRTGTDDQVEGAFTLLSSTLRAVDSARYADVVGRIARAITTGVSEKEPKAAAARLKMLANLYNMIDEATHRAEKLATLMSIIAFAAETRQVDALAPYLATAASWPARWGIEVADARKLYAAIAAALDKNGDAEASQAFLIRYLTTFEGAEAEIDDAAKERARDAAVGYVKAPAVSQRSNLPHLAVVRALATDPRYSTLSELLRVFASGTLREYVAFREAHPGFVESVGLDHTRSLDTMRLLSLCTLAGAATSLTYAEVAAALQVPVTEVESWVVRAISRGLIDARMDQTSDTVTVTRSVQRDFGAAQWGELQSKLRAWRDNVSQLIGLVETGRQSSGL